MTTINQGITKALRKSGLMFQKEIRTVLTTGARTGRVYTIRGRKHRASAAGEAPAKMTGRLAKSVGYMVQTRQLIVGEGQFYASWLENGTRRMAARPHFKKTIDNRLGDVAQYIIDETKGCFRL